MKKNLIYLLSGFIFFSLYPMDQSLKTRTKNFEDKFFRKQQDLNEDKSAKTPIFVPITSNLRFTDIVGSIPTEIADTVNEIRAAREQNSLFKSIKIVLAGPPGGGKTTLVKAIAGELDCRFYHVLAGDLITKYQGSGNERITALIKSIVDSDSDGETKPLVGTLLFIDEIDGLANEDHANTSSELRRAIQALHKLDDIEHNLLCIIATNEPDKIAKTLMSRFAQERIILELPETEKRLLLLQRLFKQHNIQAINLRKIASLLDNFDFRELEAYSRKVLHIAHYLNGAPNLALTEEAFMIALYMMYKNSILSVEQTKKLLSFWIRRLQPDQTVNIEEVLNNPLLQSSLTSLTAPEIKKAALSLKTLKFQAAQPNISVDDVFVSIYYDNPTKLPRAAHIRKIFNYFLGRDIENIGHLSDDLAGSCTGKEVHALIEAARNEIGNDADRLTFNIMKHICLLLEKKSKPYEIVEKVNVTTQYTLAGSVGGTASLNTGVEFGIPGMASTKHQAGLNAGPTLNIPYYRKSHYKHFLIEKNPLKNASDFKRIAIIGDEEEKFSRLEFCNIKLPSLTLIHFIIDYNLTLNNMDIVASNEQISNYTNFLKIISIAQLSVISIKMLIQLACELALSEQVTIISHQHITKALYELGLNMTWYNERIIDNSTIDSRFPREENAPMPAPARCVIS